MNKIKSLVEARKEFATQEACEAHLERMRWPNGVECPRCGSKDVTRLSSRRKWQCSCRYQFSVTAGTIFHKTHIDLPRWMMAVWLMCHSPKGISSKQIERELGVTYKTAWYMTKRIRWAMQKSELGWKLTGEVEVDDAVVKAQGGEVFGNLVTTAKHVVGMASRTTKRLKMTVVDRLTQAEIQRVCAGNLGFVKRIYTDDSQSYNRLNRIAPHDRVVHCRSYTIGRIHTNYVENAWSLFKRGLTGVFHFVSAKHLQEYLDEFAFRYTHMNEKHRLMELVLRSC